MKEIPQSIDAIYDAVASLERVGSAPPTLSDYLACIEDKAFDEALVLTPARELAIMHRLASMAASLSDRAVEVVDTRSVAAAQCLVVAAALEAVESGAGAVEAAEVARVAADRTELVAWFSDLASMPQQGAAKTPTAPLADTRRGRQIVHLIDGTFTPIAESASGDDELDALAAAWQSSGGPRADVTLVFHGASKARAHDLGSLLGPAAEIVSLSPALALHMGVGSVGAAWTRQA